MSHNTNLSGVTKSDVQLHTKKRFRKKYKLLETADNIDPVDELVLHKNGESRYNNYLHTVLNSMTLLWTKYYQNWSMSVEDIANQSSFIFAHD